MKWTALLTVAASGVWPLALAASAAADCPPPPCFDLSLYESLTLGGQPTKKIEVTKTILDGDLLKGVSGSFLVGLSERIPTSDPGWSSPDILIGIRLSPISQWSPFALDYRVPVKDIKHPDDGTLTVSLPTPWSTKYTPIVETPTDGKWDLKVGYGCRVFFAREPAPFGLADTSSICDGSFYNSVEFDYSFTPTPEPGTWLLLTGGFGLVGGALRRRRGLGMSAV